jgi:hypothetical protein
MRRIAEKILIENEIKTDFIFDEEYNQTEETYNYKEYKVLDKDDNVLEIGRYTQETITVDEILKQTGIRFGVSVWVIED